jgi:hypothetical protein
MNEIKFDDLKLWMGELWIENKLLQKQLNRLALELEEIKAMVKNDKKAE